MSVKNQISYNYNFLIINLLNCISINIIDYDILIILSDSISMNKLLYLIDNILKDIHYKFFNYLFFLIIKIKDDH